MCDYTVFSLACVCLCTCVYVHASVCVSVCVLVCACACFVSFMYTVFPRTVFANTINFSCSPYSNTKQGRILKLWQMLIAPIKPSSSLFGPHPCLGQ